MTISKTEDGNGKSDSARGHMVELEKQAGSLDF